MGLSNTLEKFRILETSGILGVCYRGLSFTDEPKFFQYCCELSNSPRSDSGGAAISLDEDTAKVKAYGEYIERYCLENIANELVTAKYKEISNEGIDPARFLNFRNEDLDFKREEYLRKIKEFPLYWVEGLNVIERKKTLIPAQLVYVPFKYKEPLIRPQISTGAATHETFDDALFNGILECIERDSFMLRYLCKDSLQKVRLEKELKELENYFNRYKLELSIFSTTTDLGIPSFMCLNIDRTGIGPAVSVGLKAGLEPKMAVEGAILESQQVRQWVRYCYIKDSSPIISDSQEICSAEKRAYYWYPPNKINELGFLFGEDIAIESISSPTANLEGLLNHLHKKSLDIYAVDITPDKIRDVGLCVIKAIIPQLHPLYLDENVPCLYSERLNNHLNNRKLNNIIHPFA